MTGITFASRTEQLDDLLALTCEELQLPPSWHDSADQHYHAVCDWLEAEGSPLRRLRPLMYPQGSFRIGTTVPPVGRAEYDLDFVCELAADYRLITPVGLLDLVESRLRQHGTYRTMIERLKRCIRLTYAGKFHMDILPACPEIARVATAVRIPDRKLLAWLPSDPKGFAAWFESRSRLVLITLSRKAEPIPDQETAAEKTPLQRSVQLLKRWRDLCYQRDPDRAPRSIVVTTLAGHAYQGESSTSGALTAVIDGILRVVDGRVDPPEVRNPANQGELLSEQWLQDPTSFRLFVGNLRRLKQRWEQAQLASGPAHAAILEELFGEQTKHAFRRQTERVNEARASGLLRTVTGTGILSTATHRSVPVKRNTFYGDPPARP